MPVNETRADHFIILDRPPAPSKGPKNIYKLLESNAN